MSVGQLLRNSHRRLVESRLILWGVAWSMCSLLFFYWPSSVFLRPWSNRFPPPGIIDFSYIAVPLREAQKSGLLRWGLCLIVIRLLLTPAIDAVVYSRLLHQANARYSAGACYRLYLLELMLAGLACWLLYVSQHVWWKLIYRPRYLLASGVMLGLLLFMIGLALSLHRFRLASPPTTACTWPHPRLLLLTAVVQGLLTLFFLIMVFSLYSWMWRLQGIPLVLALVLVSLIRMYGRLWKLSCVAEVWQRK